METAGLGPAPGRRVSPMGLLAVNGIAPRIHTSVFCAEGVWIIGDVEIEEDANIWFHAVLRGDINAIRIGRRTNVQDMTVVHVTHEHGVRIGSDVTIGHRAIIHGALVHEFSLIGMGATLLDGCVVGPHALVAAGAVVRENFTVPAGTLAAGIPARVVRDLGAAEIDHLKTSAKNYVAYARAFRG